MGPGAGAEYLQDQTGTVDDLGLQAAFQIALLDRRQRRVNHHDIGFQRLDQRGKPLDQPGAEQGRRARTFNRNRLTVDDVEFNGARQRFAFIEPRRRVAAVAQNRIKNYRATRVLYPHDAAAKALFFFLFIRLLFIRVGGVEQLHGLCRHDRRDGVFVDQLGMGFAAQQYAKIVKPGDDPLQLDAIYEKYGYRQLVLADVV